MKGNQEMKNENRIDYETGIVKCVCGEVLGNYFTGDFYSLISKKYCDKCRVPINKEKRREAQRRYRERKKKYNSELQKKADALEFENNLLYQQVFGNDNTPRAKKIKKLLKELSKLEKD